MVPPCVVAFGPAPVIPASLLSGAGLEEEGRGIRRVGIGRGREGAGKMRTIRRRNWFIKRIALGLAVAAIAAPVAQASVDEGIPGQPSAPQIVEGVKGPHDGGMQSEPRLVWGPHDGGMPFLANDGGTSPKL